MKAAFLRCVPLTIAMSIAACASDEPSVDDDSGSVVPEKIVPDDAESIVVTSKGGLYVTEVDPRSNCSLMDSTFTLDLRSRVLTWKTCKSSPVAEDAALTLRQFVEGTATLSDAAFAQVDASLRALGSERRERGSKPDMPQLGITVSSPRGVVSHVDSSDRGGVEEDYVVGLLPVLHQLDSLTDSTSYGWSMTNLGVPP